MMRSIWRTMARHKLHSAISVGGLALGLAVFLTMALIVRYETSYDRDVTGGDHVYRLDTLVRLPPAHALG